MLAEIVQAQTLDRLTEQTEPGPLLLFAFGCNQ
jgi:hypothetical protein